MRVGGIMDVVAKENERAKTLVQRLGRWRRTELGEVGFGLHWGERRRQWTTKLPWAQGVGGVQGCTGTSVAWQKHGIRT